MQRVITMLADRMPQYQQVFKERQSEVREELKERYVLWSPLRRNVELVQKRTRPSGAGVSATPPPTGCHGG
eukprot:5900381-Amphidinium_carterae.1